MLYVLNAFFVQPLRSWRVMPAVDELEPVVRLEVHFYAVYPPGIRVRGPCSKSKILLDKIYRKLLPDRLRWKCRNSGEIIRSVVS